MGLFGRNGVVNAMTSGSYIVVLEVPHTGCERNELKLP